MNFSSFILKSAFLSVFASILLLPTIVTEPARSSESDSQTTSESVSADVLTETETESDESKDIEKTKIEAEEKQEEINDQLESESDKETETETEQLDEDEAKKPTPEELARLEQIAIADQLYLGGDRTTARQLYRQAKTPWELERKQSSKDEPPTFDDPSQLSPAGKVFWRNYQQGQEQQLESKVISSLKLITTREPQFLPGHIHYSQALSAYEREAESVAVLNRAVNLYPNEPQILKAKMAADIADEQWLDASIMARQYALFNPNAPEAAEFELLATEYLSEYQSNLRSSITWNAVGNAIAGTVGFALTGNLFGPLSALETTGLLLQGESAVGDASVSQIKKQAPLLKDERINEYINKIGQKVASASGREEFDYEFYVIMDDTLNAFALPGGKVFINVGAIMETDSEAELAGLLAHEVAHSALSHGFQLVTKGNLTANIVSYIPYVGNAASSLIVLNYSRDMEKQADIYGTRILVNAGYAADGVRNLMAKLHHSHGEDNPEPVAWMSSHPNSKKRIGYIEQLVVEQNLDRYAYEGVYQHQPIKELATEKWQQYAKCIEDINTLQEAKVCAGEEQNKEDKAESETKGDLESENSERSYREIDSELEAE